MVASTLNLIASHALFRLRSEGQVLMANFGMKDNNHSQFAIAMTYIKVRCSGGACVALNAREAPCQPQPTRSIALEWQEFESKHVIFGKVLEGMEVLRLIEQEGSGEGFTKHPVSALAMWTQV